MENVADEKYIELICNGEFNAIPDFKIGELFESFFDNINYNVVGFDYIDLYGSFPRNVANILCDIFNHSFKIWFDYSMQEDNYV